MTTGLLTFKLLFVKKLCKADRQIWIGQVRVPFPFDRLAQRRTVVELEALVDEVDRQRDDESEEEENEETSEVNFINVFMSSFYTHRSQKCKSCLS